MDGENRQPLLKWMIWVENPLFFGNIHVSCHHKLWTDVTHFRSPVAFLQARAQINGLGQRGNFPTMALPSSKLTFNGKSLFSIGNTSSNSASSIAMLVHLGVILSQTCSPSFTFRLKKVHPFWDLLICSVWDFNQKKYAKFYTPPQFNMEPEVMMVSKRNFLFWGLPFRWTMWNFGGVMTLGMSGQSSTSWGIWRSHLRHLYDESPQVGDNHRIRLGGSEIGDFCQLGKVCFMIFVGV